MGKKFLIIALILICIMQFYGCNSTSGKVEQADTTENTSVSTPVNPKINQTESSSVDIADSSNTNVDYVDSGFDLMAKETAYILNNSVLCDDVIKLFGEPQKKSEPVVWGADGLEHQNWYYDSKGVELGFTRNDENKQEVFSIRLQSPCDLKTSRGIGIGSTKAEVMKAYEQEINPEEPNIDSSHIVVGMVYGGLIFLLENDIVTSVFIGAAAE